MKQFILLTLTLSILFQGFLQAQDINNGLLGLSQIRQHVKSKRVSSYEKNGGNADSWQNIADGEKRTIFDVKGPGMITHIWFTIAPEPEKLSRNDIILRMYWDGNDYPSVESPIGPFFGQGWNEAYNFTSLPLAATPIQGRGLVCYFTMPFAKGARIEVENQTGAKINALYFYVDYVEMDKLPANAGRFHAWYNKQLAEAPEGGPENEHYMFGPDGKNILGERNYVVADIKGKGHFVGLNYYVHSPTPLWYGEGDDMIFIDGSKEPVLNGTGTEDYFNTAWGPREVLAHPYFGYARVNNDIATLGRTHLFRFNITDPVYFDKSLKFTIEHGSNNCLTLDLASVAYWYQDEAARIPAIPNKEARKPKPFINAYDIHRWRNEWRKNNGNDPKLW